MPRLRPAASARLARLRVYLLEAFRLEREPTDRASLDNTHRHADVLRLPTHKNESLFAYLILHPEPQPREQLAALLWGNVPDQLARSSLRRALVLLRQELGQGAVITDRANGQLNPDLRLWVDVREFQREAAEFLRGSHTDLTICPILPRS